MAKVKIRGKGAAASSPMSDEEQQERAEAIHTRQEIASELVRGIGASIGSSVKETAFVDEVNKKYGKGTIVKLGKQPPTLRIPTGVFDLDVSLGGGVPQSRITMIWGPRSSGKSTLCAHIVRQAQRLCRHDGQRLGLVGAPGNSMLPLQPEFRNKKGEVVDAQDAIEEEEIVNEDMSTTTKPKMKDGYTVSLYQEPMRTLLVNQEGAIDSSWVADIGVNPDLVYCLNTDTAEQTIDIIDSMMRQRVVDVVVVDSVAAMTPSTETEESMENWQQGLQARLINKALRVWVSTLNSFRDAPVRPTMILVNQVRTNIGIKYGSKDVKPGGVGQEFATSAEIKLAQGSVDKDTDLADEDEGGHLLLSRVNFKVTKNKTSAAQGIGQFFVGVTPHDGNLPGQIIQTKVILDRAQQYGLLLKGKKGWEMNGQTFPTLKAVAQWTVDEPEAFEGFTREFMKVLVLKRSGKLVAALAEAEAVTA